LQISAFKFSILTAAEHEHGTLPVTVTFLHTHTHTKYDLNEVR